MHSPRITHIALHVRNLDACIQFYREFCGMDIVHRRDHDAKSIVWMAEPGREKDFIFVLMNGGEDLQLTDTDYRHFGFALESREQVDLIARRAEIAGCLIWPPREDPFPVGYYCGLQDPNGNYIEFSYGQPLGPGAEAATEKALKA
ncbi:VOC family protein [Hahella ganghwensis]|uniref:VOC family protein n=1 Tax=Hahella ganghwensis TaxID=286420 RepID=UPI000366C2A0|nr:VOC family protein [Hahella ganghwensis]